MLAILVCRLMEGEDSESMKGVYQEYFIDRGVQNNDPFMVSIGRWGRKEYVMALNAFQLEARKYMDLDHMFKYSSDRHNLL
jgi:hypothetical protein